MRYSFASLKKWINNQPPGFVIQFIYLLVLCNEYPLDPNANPTKDSLFNCLEFGALQGLGENSHAPFYFRLVRWRYLLLIYRHLHPQQPDFAGHPLLGTTSLGTLHYARLHSSLGFVKDQFCLLYFVSVNFNFIVAQFIIKL